ncbi:MAG: aspartate kinase, partial [Spirochaetales bacterium]|nr:aspartate kinase [Spirochaetales bacterium]
RERFTGIAQDLACGIDIGSLLDEVEDTLAKGGSRDYAGSRGEYLSARIITDYLGAAFVEAGDGILFTEDGGVDPETYHRFHALLLGEGLFVIPGFYGTGADGKVKIFSRGGSDITGALVARASGSHVYENWTDVSGLLMADPRIIDHPAPVPEVTYREIRELAAMGANVFHEEAMIPVRDAGIPINIKNTNDPDHPGTRIVNEHTVPVSIAGVSGIRGVSLVRVGKTLMNREPTFVGSVKKALDKSGISVLRTFTGVDTATLLCAGGNPTVEDLNRTTDADTVSVHLRIALVTLVGEGLNLSGVCALLKGLSDAAIAVELADYASSGISVTVAVKEEAFKKTLETVYSASAP